MLQMMKKRRRPKILLILILLVLAAGVVLMLTSNKPGNHSPGVTTDGTHEDKNMSNSEDDPDHKLSPAPDQHVQTPVPTAIPTPIPEPTISVSEPEPSQVPEVSVTPDPNAEPVPESIEALKEELEQYIEKQKGKYGLSFVNLVTGETIGINDKDEFIAASTTKMPMNLLLYKKVASGEISLDSKLYYLEEDFEEGTGVIQKSPYGTEYTVRETARLSIIYSDNCGINMIIRLLGIDNIRKYMQDLGGTVYYGKRHRTCPYDLTLYAAELYRFYQENPEVAGLLIEDLQNTIWNDRINKLLPADVKVSHKIGNYEAVCNDVGIVFATEPYALAVLSDGVDQSVAADVIAKLSRKIYDFVEQKQ